MRDPGTPVLDLSLKVRLGFAIVALLYAALSGEFISILPWALLVMALDIGASVVRAWVMVLPVARTSLLWGLLAASALASGIAFNLNGSAAATLSFIPAYHAGLAFGRMGFLWAAILCAGSGIVAGLAGSPSPYPDHGVPQFIMWVGATVMLGILGTWSASLGPHEGPGQHDDAEARYLLERLREIAQERGSGFDAPSVGSEVIDELGATVPHDRAVLFTQAEGAATRILALGGVRRVWREISVDLLDQGLHVIDYQEGGRSRSSLVIPLVRPDPRQRHGLILDRAAERAFTSGEISAARRRAEVAAPALDVALLFESLREVAVIEERNHLAREMHDGIAQDLAALGFQIDSVRLTAAGDGPAVAAKLDELRAQLGSVISDLRLRMSDLAMTQRGDRNVVALLGQALQRFGASHRIRTSLDVSEGQLQLSPHLEIDLLRAVGAVLDDARTGMAGTVCVLLDTAPDLPHLEIEHDGQSQLTSAPSLWPSPLRGRLLVEVHALKPRGVRVHLTPSATVPPMPFHPER